jgi:hypothetical protein
MKLTKNILAGIGIGVVAYLVAKKMGNKKTVKINVDPKSSADGVIANGITYDNLGNEGLEDIYGLNNDNFYQMDGEFYSADGDFVSANGDFYDADGDFMNASGTCYHSADGVVMNDGEFADIDFDERDTMSFASGNTIVNMKTKATAKPMPSARPKVQKKKFPKGKKVGNKQRALAIWKRRLQALTKARAKGQQKVDLYAKRMYRTLDNKIAQAKQKIATLQGNAPQNQ